MCPKPYSEKEIGIIRKNPDPQLGSNQSRNFQCLKRRMKTKIDTTRAKVECIPYTDAAPEVLAADVVASDGSEEVAEAEVAEVEGSLKDEDEMVLVVSLDAEDSVALDWFAASVADAVFVLISAAGTVTFLIATPVLVYTHRHLGVSRTMWSPMTVVERPILWEAPVYVFSHAAALPVFVAARLASGVGLPWVHCARPVAMGCRPPCCWGPSMPQHTRLSKFMVLLALPYRYRSLVVSTISPAQHMVP